MRLSGLGVVLALSFVLALVLLKAAKTRRCVAVRSG
jgi:hypothetical protein